MFLQVVEGLGHLCHGCVHRADVSYHFLYSRACLSHAAGLVLNHVVQRRDIGGNLIDSSGSLLHAGLLSIHLAMNTLNICKDFMHGTCRVIRCTLQVDASRIKHSLAVLHVADDILQLLGESIKAVYNITDFIMHLNMNAFSKVSLAGADVIKSALNCLKRAQQPDDNHTGHHTENHDQQQHEKSGNADYFSDDPVNHAFVAESRDHTSDVPQFGFQREVDIQITLPEQNAFRLVGVTVYFHMLKHFLISHFRARPGASARILNSTGYADIAFDNRNLNVIHILHVIDKALFGKVVTCNQRTEQIAPLVFNRGCCEHGIAYHSGL